jgi:hypothetical protein
MIRRKCLISLLKKKVRRGRAGISSVPGFVQVVQNRSMETGFRMGLL